MKIKKLVYAWIILLGAIGLGACTPTGQSPQDMCAYIAEPQLLSLPAEAQQRSQITAWVGQTYGVAAEAVDIYEYVGKEVTEVVAWTHAGKRYMASFQGDKLRQFSVLWNEQAPTAAEVVDCYGAPEFYGANWKLGPHTSLLELELWYPANGVKVAHSQTTVDYDPPPITSDLPMEELTIVPPGSLEAVVMETLIPRSVGQRQRALESLQPWPGRWEAVALTQDFRQE